MTYNYLKQKTLMTKNTGKVSLRTMNEEIPGIEFSDTKITTVWELHETTV